MQNGKEYDVFIAYSEDDIDEVKALAKLFKREGFRAFVWSEELEETVNSGNFRTQINRAIDKSYVFAFVSSLSSRSVKCDALLQMGYVEANNSNMPRVEYVVDDYEGGNIDSTVRDFFKDYDSCDTVDKVINVVSDMLSHNKKGANAKKREEEDRVGKRQPDNSRENYREREEEEKPRRRQPDNSRENYREREEEEKPRRRQPDNSQENYREREEGKRSYSLRDNGVREEENNDDGELKAKYFNGNVKYCLNCRAPNKQSAKFCFECGKNKFASSYEEYLESRMKFCKKCGTKNNRSNKFCEECGSSSFAYTLEEYQDYLESLKPKKSQELLEFERQNQVEGATLVRYCDEKKAVTIPEGITEIGKSAFEDNRQIESVTLAKSVKAIGANAFCACSKLKSITLTSGVKKIGEGAFSGTAIESCELPNGLLKISPSLFERSAIKSIKIPKGVEEIGEMAFLESQITEVEIPSGVKYVGDNAFFSCNKLTKVTISESVKEMGASVFASCENLRRINCYASRKPSGWDSDWMGDEDCKAKIVWGYEAGNEDFDVNDSDEYNIFANKNDVKDSVLYLYRGKEDDLIVPEGIVGIEGELLSKPGHPEILQDVKSIVGVSDRLKSVVLPSSLAYIDCAAFSRCVNLIEVHIPEGVTNIGDYAFGLCSGLKEINIPDGATNIGTYTFQECAIDSIYIPESVLTVGRAAFYGCKKLKYIYCGADRQPEGWDEAWHEECNSYILWGCKK